jgi:hypothetical protein
MKCTGPCNFDMMRGRSAETPGPLSDGDPGAPILLRRGGGAYESTSEPRPDRSIPPAGVLLFST